MNKINGKVLLVEDDKNLGFILKDFLEIENYKVDLFENGQAGWEGFNKNKYDICLLDVMMPLKDGFTLAEEIRKEDCEIPIIFITAKTMQEDKIRGLRIGADDYITKPFSTEELNLRIKAILKRMKYGNGLVPKPTGFKIGDFTFDYTNQLLTWPAGERRLTKKESEVLRLLCLHKNSIVRRDFALKTIWGENDYFMGRSMDVYITKLRKFLKDDDKVAIVNVHNTGFKLEVMEEDEISKAS